MSYSFNVQAPTRSGLGAVPADKYTTPTIPKKPTTIPEYGGPTGYPTYDWVYHSEINRWVWQRATVAVRSTPPAQVFPPPPPPVTILPGISNIPNTTTLPAAATVMDNEPLPYSQRPGVSIATKPINPVTTVTPTPVIDTSTGVQVGTVTGVTATGIPVVTPTVGTTPPGSTVTPITADITDSGATTPDWIKAGVWLLGGFILWSTFRKKGRSSGRSRRHV